MVDTQTRKVGDKQRGGVTASIGGGNSASSCSGLGPRLALAIAALLLMGCDTTDEERPKPRSQPNTPPNTDSQPQPVTNLFFSNMIEAIRKKRGWDFSGTGPNEDKHRGFFALKRTEILSD